MTIVLTIKSVVTIPTISHGSPLPLQSLRSHFTEAQLKRFINFNLRYIADLDIPIKRGTFVEFRTGLINICPIGAFPFLLEGRMILRV